MGEKLGHVKCIIKCCTGMSVITINISYTASSTYLRNPYFSKSIQISISTMLIQHIHLNCCLATDTVVS